MDVQYCCNDLLFEGAELMPNTVVNSLSAPHCAFLYIRASAQSGLPNLDHCFLWFTHSTSLSLSFSIMLLMTKVTKNGETKYLRQTSRFFQMTLIVQRLAMPHCECNGCGKFANFYVRLYRRSLFGHLCPRCLSDRGEPSLSSESASGPFSGDWHNPYLGDIRYVICGLYSGLIGVW